MGRLEVGREAHLDVEGDLELHAVGQREVVDPAVEGHDPAVQQRLGADRLAAEVVDHEDAVVGLHLQRRQVDAVGLLVGQVEAGRGQLAAGDDGRAPAQHPPGVEAGGLGLLGAVDDGVEHDDHLAVDLDGPGDQDAVVVDADEPLGDGRLAGARRAVEEHGALGDERRAQLVEQPVVDHQVVERLAHRRVGDGRVGGLGADDPLVLDEADWGGAGVPALLEPVVGLLAAVLGEADDVVVALEPEHLDEAQVAQLVDDPGHQVRVQGQALAEAQRRRPSLEERSPQRQVLDQPLGDVQIFHALRWPHLVRQHAVPPVVLSSRRSPLAWGRPVHPVSYRRRPPVAERGHVGVRVTSLGPMTHVRRRLSPWSPSLPSSSCSPPSWPG